MNHQASIPQSTSAPELLSMPEAASALGCSADTVRRLIRQGRLASVRLGRSVRIPREDLLRLITQSSTTSSS